MGIRRKLQLGRLVKAAGRVINQYQDDFQLALVPPNLGNVELAVTLSMRLIKPLFRQKQFSIHKCPVICAACTLTTGTYIAAFVKTEHAHLSLASTVIG